MTQRRRLLYLLILLALLPLAYGATFIIERPRISPLREALNLRDGKRLQIYADETANRLSARFFMQDAQDLWDICNINMNQGFGGGSISYNDWGIRCDRYARTVFRSAAAAHVNFPLHFRLRLLDSLSTVWQTRLRPPAESKIIITCREEEVSLWLDVWREINSHIDPTFVIPTTPLLPPSAPGYPPGIDPSNIRDPVVRRAYAAACATHSALLEKISDQIHWRRMRDSIRVDLIRHLVDAFDCNPKDDIRLEAVIKECKDSLVADGVKLYRENHDYMALFRLLHPKP